MPGYASQIDSLCLGLNPELKSRFAAWLDARCSTAHPQTRSAIYSEVTHFSRYCEQQGRRWLPADRLVIRNYVQAYRYSRSYGAISRCVGYLRDLHQSLQVDLTDPLVDKALKDIAESQKYRAADPIRCDHLRHITNCLRNDSLGLYTKALLWTTYDSQFRASSLLQVKLEQLKVVRPSGIVWLPWPERPVRWEEDGGLLPPSTACHLRDWFRSAGIVEGYLFPVMSDDRATEMRATPAYALRRVQRALAEAGVPSRGVSLESVRRGAVADMQAALVGIPGMMQRAGLRTYRSVKSLLRNFDSLDSGSLELAHLQGRWGEPDEY